MGSISNIQTLLKISVTVVILKWFHPTFFSTVHWYKCNEILDIGVFCLKSKKSVRLCLRLHIDISSVFLILILNRGSTEYMY